MSYYRLNLCIVRVNTAPISPPKTLQSMLANFGVKVKIKLCDRCIPIYYNTYTYQKMYMLMS